MKVWIVDMYKLEKHLHGFIFCKFCDSDIQMGEDLPALVGLGTIYFSL